MSVKTLKSTNVSVLALTATLDPGVVTASTVSEQSFTVPGAKLGDVVLAVSKPTETASITFAGGRVTADDTVAVSIVAQAAPGTLGSEVYTVVVAGVRP